jgi:putative NIF3 family GTP cyclohydrolase 1 type 2
MSQRAEVANRKLTGRAAELLINDALGDPMSTARYEGLCAGNPNSLVTGVVVCYAPTVTILRRAASEQKTLIISREHPLYLHGGLNYGYTTEGLEELLKDDPVAAAKKEIITTHNLMVYRFGAGWDEYRPQAQSTALAASLGLAPISKSPLDRTRGVVCDLRQPTTLAVMAQLAVDRIKCTSPRIIGDMHSKITRVAVLAGETDPKQALAKLISNPRIDGVIAGAGGTIDEVDGAISYFQDVIATGRKIALLALGYGPSEEPGVADMAKWMQPVLPDVKVEYWATSDPSWIPRPKGTGDGR